MIYSVTDVLDILQWQWC